jgi:hypothetical protein
LSGFPVGRAEGNAMNKVVRLNAKTFSVKAVSVLPPVLIAKYQTELPDKIMLAAKVQEFYLLNAPEKGLAPLCPS